MCRSAGILLELVEDRPAEHVGQEDVEGDGGGPVLLREHERVRAPRRREDLESLAVRLIDEDAGEVGIVLHDEEDGIALDDLVAVIGHREGDLLGGRGTTSTAARRRCAAAAPAAPCTDGPT